MPNSIKNLGVSAVVPDGWDARIYQTPFAGAVFQASNVPLSADYSDFGDPEWYPSLVGGGVFITVVEQDPAFAGQGIYAQPFGSVASLKLTDASPSAVIRSVPGLAGLQSSFSASGRAFMLYIVVSTQIQLQGALNAAVGGILGQLQFDAGNFMAPISPNYLVPVSS